jgi:hypothetical protein
VSGLRTFEIVNLGPWDVLPMSTVIMSLEYNRNARLSYLNDY